MTHYRLTVRIESLRGPLPSLNAARHDLLQIIADALPGATARGLSIRIVPERGTATFQLTVETQEVITRDELYLIEVGTLDALPSPVDPRTLEVLGPDITVHAEPQVAV